MKYIPLFTLIQLVSLVLTVLGLPICAALALGANYKCGPPGSKWHFAPNWAWIWDNDEDGIAPHWYNPLVTPWKVFAWTALRNPCNNLRYVPGVSKPGRPLWLWTWTVPENHGPFWGGGWPGKQFYFKAGWEAKTGWPSLSAGSGNGF